MKTNKPTKHEAKTHEGARADAHQKPVLELERAVSTCLLWEETFYEKGNDLAARIVDLCSQVAPHDIAALAIKARKDLKLRHVPLFLCVQLLKRKAGKIAGETIAAVIQRPDEMGELISLYRKDKRVPLAAQLKKGLRAVFPRFTSYQLAKWNGDAAYKLRDVMFLVKPKPANAEQAGIWKTLIAGTLASPDTWEVALSSGRDKKTTWERLLNEKKLGDMALLMNLRNMHQVGVDRNLIIDRLAVWSPKSVALPYRFIAAATAAPDYEDALGKAMTLSLSQATKLTGRTLYLIDVSGSMQHLLSEKSTMDRIDAACGLAMLMREVSDDVTIYATAGNDSTRVHATAKIPPRHTFALRDAVKSTMKRLGGGGIFCFQALTAIQKEEAQPFDRVVILTDEQDCDTNPAKRLENAPLLGRYNYLFNVASYQPGLELGGKWIRINGWSERIIDWVQLHEQAPQ